MKQISKPRLQNRRIALCLSVLVAVFVNGSIAKSADSSDESNSQEKTVKAYRLRGNFNIRSEANQESQNFGRIDHSEAEGMKFSTVKGDEKWFKVDLDNGGSGYVNRHALQQVELKGNYVIHADASLESHRVGTVSQIKHPEDLVVTGNQKLVDEGGKKIEWVEVMAHGKRAWVAGGALSDQAPIHEAKQFESTRHETVAPKNVPLPIPRPQAPVTNVAPPKVVPAKLVPPPIRVVKDETHARNAVPAPAVLPVVKPLPPARPIAKPVIKPIALQPVPPAKIKASPAVLPPINANQLPVRPLPAPVRPIAPVHPVPPANIPNVAPAQPPVVVAPRPAPLKEIECATTKEEYMQNSRLRSVYGRDYNPYVPWHSWCVNSQPLSGGRWHLNICGIGSLRTGYSEITIPVSICYNFTTGQAYTITKGKVSPFNGRDFDHLNLVSDEGDTVVTREASPGVVQ